MSPAASGEAEKLSMRHFVSELDRLQHLVLDMAAAVESAVHRSVAAVLERDESLARQVIAQERAVDRMELAIDDEATRLLVLNQPVAKDLRFLTAVMRMNKDLERMGDLAVNIAQRAMSLAHVPAADFVIDISHLENLVERMLSLGVQSFADRNEELARTVLAADDEIDQIRNDAYRVLVSHMEAHPSTAKQDVDLLFVVHSLERIADHATNIAEDVLLVIKGVDVRHHADV